MELVQLASRVERSGSIETFEGDEIVLCAGAVMSPHLLLVSGRRPGSLVTPPRHRGDRRSAGCWTHCSDHPQVFVGFETSRKLPRRPGAGVVEVALDTIVDGAPDHLMPYLAPMAELVPGSAASANRAGDRSLAGACRKHDRDLLRSDDLSIAGHRLPLASNRQPIAFACAELSRSCLSILERAPMARPRHSTHSTG